MTVMPGPTWLSSVGDKPLKSEEDLKSIVRFITQNKALTTASVGYLSRVLVAIVDMNGLIIV